MDEYDVIDFVYDAVQAADTGVTVYKDKSDAGVKVEHIVINTLQLNELDFINKVPVNVNIFVPLLANGMYKRARMQELRRKVRRSLGSISSSDGHCREFEIQWVQNMNDVKEGFICVNIRLDIIIDNN